MGDGVNAGDRSDRIVVEWRLASPQAIDASEHRPRTVERPAIDGGRAVARLRVGPGGVPEVKAGGGRVELFEIPADIVALRNGDAELARRWRVAVAETLGPALATAHLDGITRDGWYVVRRDRSS
jgi:predicted GNAT superfamily acetyltransferase